MNGASTIGGTLSAYLTIFPNPKSPGETKNVSIGDDVQGYTVSEITDTTVSLRWNEVEEIIDMAENESMPQQQKAPQKLAAVNIIRIGSALAAVETTTSDESAEDDQRGLQIGVVGNQNARGGAAGARGMQNTAAGRLQGGARGRSGSRGMTNRSGVLGSSTQRNMNFPNRP
jgi:hypothetical protein